MNKLWLAQVRGVLRLELRKGMLGRRALPIYIWAALPVGVLTLILTVFSVAGVPTEMQGTTGAFLFFVAAFQPILRFIIYFGCVWIFMNLFRGEVLDRSLHYYFLTPVRREVLAAGKFLSAWVTSTVVFGGATTICYVMVYAVLGRSGPGGGAFDADVLGLLLQYLGVVALACLGYGAVFLVVSLFLRSLVIPALVIFLWESINTFLPAAFKKISVIFYLQGLIPLPPPDGPVQILAEPVSPWLAIPGLVLFTALTLVAAGLRIRRMEIAYGAD